MSSSRSIDDLVDRGLAAVESDDLETATQLLEEATAVGARITCGCCT
jgi:hypothetical protein